MSRATGIHLDFSCSLGHSFRKLVWVCKDRDLVVRRNLFPLLGDVLTSPCSNLSSIDGCRGIVTFRRPQGRRSVSPSPVLVGYNPSHKIDNPLDRYQFPARADEAALMPGYKPVWLSGAHSLDQFSRHFELETGKVRWHEQLNLDPGNFEHAIDPTVSEREDDSKDLDPDADIGFVSDPKLAPVI